MHCCHLSGPVSVARHIISSNISLTFVLLAAELAQQHAAQLLPPVDMLRVVLLDHAVVVALALGVGRPVELVLRGAIPQRLSLVAHHVEAVGFAGKNRVKGRQGLCHCGQRLHKHCAGEAGGRKELRRLSWSQAIFCLYLPARVAMRCGALIAATAVRLGVTTSGNLIPARAKTRQTSCSPQSRFLCLAPPAERDGRGFFLFALQLHRHRS